PAPVSRKFQAGLGALQTDGHAFLVGQLRPANAANKGAAEANSVVDAGKVLQFAQPRNASRQSHGGGADRKADAQAGNPERIVAPAIGQHTATSTGTHDETGLGEYDADITRSLCVRWPR